MGIIILCLYRFFNYTDCQYIAFWCCLNDMERQQIQNPCKYAFTRTWISGGRLAIPAGLPLVFSPLHTAYSFWSCFQEEM